MTHLSHNRTLLSAASALALLSLTPAAFAQTAQPTDKADEAVQEVVVTGTRVVGRSRLDTLAPVDVLTSTALQRQATTELAQSLSTLAPSITFPRPSATDGTDSVRPATLRGLSPDQTLVLVNGTRRHASALINVNGSVGRGSQAVDLNAIPTAALERVEILRDGASAQYGSDAIAGVVNLRLREARKGGNVTAGYSYYDTDIKTARGNRSEVDGTTYSLSGWVGLPLGENGFVTLSGDYRDRGATSRGDRDPRVTPSVVTSRYGDPKAKDVTLYVNAGLPLANGWTAYGWAGGQKRESESAAFFRIASNSSNVPAIYPNGFLPLITVDSDDFTVAGGTRGELGGWATDLSVVYGRNALELGVRNSLNPTYGTASPRQFEAGAFIYDQVSLSADFSRQFDVAAFAGPLNVAFGAEAREESYRIKAGEPKSWDRGPITSATPGAQGFPGLQPSNAVDQSRRNFGLYVDLEAEVIENLTASLAVRAEDYSDFGNNVSGKLSARYDFTPQFALRGSVASGFRAPSLAQQFYTATSTNFINGVPFETGTFPATSATARALGAQPLDAETSLNTALGAVYRNGPFELTLDAYQINIDDRIVLSENLGGRADIDTILAPFGVTRARFFINGVDTETKGADLVARYRFDTGAFGKFDTSLAASVTETEITRLPRTARLSALTPAPDLFARVAQTIITDGTPKSRATATVDWSLGGFGATFKAVNYGKAIEPGSTAASDISSGNKTLVDLEGRYAFGQGTSLTLGASNLFDVYPDRTPAALNTTGTLGFTRYSPFGFNGRQLYVRLSHNW